MKVQMLLLELWPVEVGGEEGKVTWKTELQQTWPTWVVASSLIQDSGISQIPCACSDALLIASPLLALAAPWPLTPFADFSPLQLPHKFITICCPLDASL